MVIYKKHNKHRGGRTVATEPSITIINYDGHNPYFNREIWDAHGSPTKLALGDGWTSIDDFTFMDTNIEKIKIPTSITYIGNSAFENTQKLNEVIFNQGSQLETIGEAVFKNAKALTTIDIPNRIETIPFSAFERAKTLSYINIDSEHSQLKNIEAGAFNYTNLYSIKLPKSIQRIGTYVFFENNNLREIYIYRDTLARLNRNEFITEATFGLNEFDDNNMFYGLNHPVNIIELDNLQGGRRKSYLKTRKSKLHNRRTYKNKSRRRRTIKHK